MVILPLDGIGLLPPELRTLLTPCFGLPRIPAGRIQMLQRLTRSLYRASSKWKLELLSSVVNPRHQPCPVLIIPSSSAGEGNSKFRPLSKVPSRRVLDTSCPPKLKDSNPVGDQAAVSLLPAIERGRIPKDRDEKSPTFRRGHREGPPSRDERTLQDQVAG